MKRGLLSMIALALSFIGAVSVSAQSWTASSVSAGTYVLYNVGAGQYFVPGNDWGTRASITTSGNLNDGLHIQIEAVGSNFKLRTDINGSGYGVEHLSGGTIYTDQSRGKNSSWTFTQVGDNNGPIYTIMSAENHGGGAGKYMAANSGNTIVDPVDDASSTYAQWQLVKMKTAEEIRDDALAARTATYAALSSASPSNPVDATPIILDANFDISLLKDSWQMVANNYNPQGGSAANPCAESWRSAFTLSQQLTGLPEGTYVLRAQAAITDYAGLYDGADYPVVYANEVTTPFINMEEEDRGTSMTKLSGSFSNGKYEVEPLTVIVGEDGILTVGVKGTRTDTWCIWDNFRLEFYGFDLASLVNAYKNALATAQAIDGKMSSQAKSDLNSAISTYSSINESDKNEVRAALSALNAAVAAAQQSIDDYAKMADFIDEYSSAPGINAIKLAYENGAYADINDFYNQFRSVILSTVSGKDGVDISAVILNNCPTANSDFWDGNKSNAYDPGNNVAEFWNMSGAYMSQTLPQLPEGTYFLTVKALTRTGFNATVSTSTGASINVATVDNTVVNNRGQAKDWFDAGNGDNMLAFNVIGAPQDVTITLKADDANGDHWLVWRNFKLEYNTLKELVFSNFGTPTFTLADGTVINDGDTKNNVNENQIKDGIVISFPGNVIKNVPIHPSHYQAKGKIENTTDGITYIIRSNGYYANGYNPNFDIHFGWGLFGWSNSALEEYIAAVGYDGNKVGQVRKAKTYKVTIDELAFINTEMDAVDMQKGYEANVIGMSHPGTYTPGTYTVPDTKDMTAEDYNNGMYIYNMFVDYFTAKHGYAPVVEYTDVDALLEMQRYYNGWQLHDGNGAMDGPKGEDAARPYRPLTSDEIEYIRFFLATYCEGVIMEKNTNVTVPYTFTIKTAATVQQDSEKITRDQVVTAWDVKGNQVTDLLFEQGAGVETSIEGIEAASEDNAIYNLAGQRVQTARKGIFVVGGKKVVLK